MQVPVSVAPRMLRELADGQKDTFAADEGGSPLKHRPHLTPTFRTAAASNSVARLQVESLPILSSEPRFTAEYFRPIIHDRPPHHSEQRVAVRRMMPTPLGLPL